MVAQIRHPGERTVYNVGKGGATLTAVPSTQTSTSRPEGTQGGWIHVGSTWQWQGTGSPTTAPPIAKPGEYVIAGGQTYRVDASGQMASYQGEQYNAVARPGTSVTQSFRPSGIQVSSGFLNKAYEAGKIGALPSQETNLYSQENVESGGKLYEQTTSLKLEKQTAANLQYKTTDKIPTYKPLSELSWYPNQKYRSQIGIQNGYVETSGAERMKVNQIPFTSKYYGATINLPNKYITPEIKKQAQWWGAKKGFELGAMVGMGIGGAIYKLPVEPTIREVKPKLEVKAQSKFKTESILKSDEERIGSKTDALHKIEYKLGRQAPKIETIRANLVSEPKLQGMKVDVLGEYGRFSQGKAGRGGKIPVGTKMTSGEIVSVAKPVVKYSSGGEIGAGISSAVPRTTIQTPKKLPGSLTETAIPTSKQTETKFAYMYGIKPAETKVKIPEVKTYLKFGYGELNVGKKTIPIKFAGIERLRVAPPEKVPMIQDWFSKAIYPKGRPTVTIKPTSAEKPLRFIKTPLSAEELRGRSLQLTNEQKQITRTKGFIGSKGDIALAEQLTKSPQTKRVTSNIQKQFTEVQKGYRTRYSQRQATARTVGKLRQQGMMAQMLGTATGTGQLLRTKSTTSTLQRQMQQSFQRQIQTPSQLQRQIQTPAQQQNQLQRQLLRTTTTTTPPTSIIPAMIITQVPRITPGLPGSPGGALNLGRWARSNKGNRGYKYTPSFAALAFNIRGKKPKQTQFTGFEVRPIPISKNLRSMIRR